MVPPITMRLVLTENSKAQQRIHAYTKQKKVQYVYDYYLAITIYLTEIVLFRYLNKKSKRFPGRRKVLFVIVL